MVPALRKAFNEAFTRQRYDAFLTDLRSRYPGAIEFRIAETPVFVPADFSQLLQEACEHIIDVILEPRFKEWTQRAIPPQDEVARENDHPHFLVFDFGVCEDGQGGWQPQLIEMQGFASLYGFQVYYPETLRRHFSIPANYSQFLNGLDHDSYLTLLRDTILGDCSPENVILLEIKPHEQKTRVDFYCTRDYLGIQPICLTELIQEGKQLFYKHPATGKKTLIRRIYNRLIFDELHTAAATLPPGFADIRQDLDVEWVAHPNWFYRVSKFTLPFLRHPFVPSTWFLNELKQPPADLENYVLKPLFSFAGQGVIIDVSPQDLDVSDPENWILQRKVKYAGLIPTPDVPAKAEIRMMYLWPDGAPRPTLAINLARLSKGKMIGVNYNKDREWVGGSVGFFQR
ncbi:hypothetical protein [Puia dinghuensis]|uniref:Circularly permuted type 2 ATP-grasp protein n=1 Tax=Puia dinghuensis TaxID=1792502 RepID=A0A8J2U9Y5_9BACT|nr:hypothetical protein [Puia dinghuensis]GGA89636.1 hypothetical protein GCM10011511_11090 [Puia dinghuensis]